MWLHTAVALTLCITASYAALTAQEIAKFQNNGACGGYVSLTENSGNYMLSTNGLPDHHWECINPNTPTAAANSWTLPKDPSPLSSPQCTSLGVLGVAVNGVFLMNPLTAEDMNAVTGGTEEEFDLCGGHPTPFGDYHYHHLPEFQSCNNPVWDVSDDRAQLLGIALDGNPIYTQGVYNGEQLTSSGLDECHGRVLPGEDRYAYVAVRDHFPYIMGCFRSQPVDRQRSTCLSGGASGELCHCPRNGGVQWLTFSDVTTEVRQKRSESNSFMKMLDHLRWARRVGIRQQGSVPSCAHNPAVLDSDGQCPGGTGNGGQGGRPPMGDGDDDTGDAGNTPGGEQGPPSNGRPPFEGGPPTDSQGRPPRPSGGGPGCSPGSGAPGCRPPFQGGPPPSDSQGTPPRPSDGGPGCSPGSGDPGCNEGRPPFEGGPPTDSQGRPPRPSGGRPPRPRPIGGRPGGSPGSGVAGSNWGGRPWRRALKKLLSHLK